MEWKGVTYDDRHGGPFDRGSADSYYRRGPDPHFYIGSTYQSDRVDEGEMSVDEVKAYYAGYMYNEEEGSKKEY